MPDFSFMASWPDWVEDVVWTAGIVLIAYVVGHVLRVFVGARLKRLATRTASRSDDVLLEVLDARIGLWSLLIGVYFALPHWPLTSRGYETWVRVLSAIGVASFTFGLATLATQLVVSYGSRTSTVVTGLTQNVIRIVVTVLGALVIVRSFGYDITPMLTALGVGGLAVALALQEPLSNLFAGLFVSFAGQIHVGNYVKLDNGAEGFVVDFNWRSTRLRQLAGNMVEVPNAKLSQAVVTNFSLPTPEMGFGVDVVVDMDSDLALVERIAEEVVASVAQDVPGVIAAGDVRFQGFVDAGVKFSVGVKIREFTDQYLVKHELVKRLHTRLTAEHIELADIRALRRGGRPT